MKETILSFWNEVREVQTKDQHLVMDARKETFFDKLFEWFRSIDISEKFIGFDYDGTLAPLVANPMQAFPYPGIPERLDALSEVGLRMGIITGRKAMDIPMLLQLRYPLEISGNHGYERLSVKKNFTHTPIFPKEREALEEVESWMERAKEMGTGVWYERKPASIVLHWRNLIDAGQDEKIASINTFMEGQWKGLRRPWDTLRYDNIEGGIEIRTKGRDKGKVFIEMMQSAKAGAYLGDDTTDEDVFGAIVNKDELIGRAVGVLVRDLWKHPRKPASDAVIQLKPPQELLWFLDRLYDVCLGVPAKIVSLPRQRYIGSS